MMKLKISPNPLEVPPSGTFRHTPTFPWEVVGKGYLLSVLTLCLHHPQCALTHPRGFG